MIISQLHQRASLAQKGMVMGVILNIALIGIGLVLFPSTMKPGGDGWRSVFAAEGILIVYGVIGFWGTAALEKNYPGALRPGILFGLLAGGVFALEICLEYLFLPKDNTQYGFFEYGLVFLLFFIAGLWTSWQTGRVRDGLLAAVWSALISSLIWYAVLLISYYIFHGTLRQNSVFAAEGTFDDFRSSGETNFDAFVMVDFLGACFFHLLLAPLIAYLLGSLGGVFGKSMRWLARRR